MFILEGLIGLVAPHRCLVCGNEGAILCDWCLPDFAPPTPSRCYRCSVATSDSRVCQKCRRGRPLRHVWVRASYAGLVQQLVRDFKFERRQAAVVPMAKLLAEALPYLDPDVIVTHVPTASQRVRHRGYDHAKLLARALAKELNLRHQTLLVRTTQTRQVGAKREQRLRQMQGAFRAVGRGIDKESILLVDDLVTTGATLEAAARCLRGADAKTISAAVFAQKQ